MRVGLEIWVCRLVLDWDLIFFLQLYWISYSVSLLSSKKYCCSEDIRVQTWVRKSSEATITRQKCRRNYISNILSYQEPLIMDPRFVRFVRRILLLLHFWELLLLCPRLELILLFTPVIFPLRQVKIPPSGLHYSDINEDLLHVESK